jgi:hypothetical protein
LICVNSIYGHAHIGPAQTGVRAFEQEGEDMAGSTAHDGQVREELERRLALLEDPTYEDPARADLPGRDIALVAVLVLVICIVAYLWGY